ncbi:hypothetical protein AWM70_22270 [Paenibacillus yonginensis]|uniref:Uncharacterized protein n=1 Tax=Paenibacillus yonginensis TaxID=1462996 RepID=A0A1B1N6D3_9BACL|nr:three component ABC system middle component [Paenibacillus yonginensis]ANS76972.1 hypothetical protein AWM70_22270 [Paenibacillus yonginensis]
MSILHIEILMYNPFFLSKIIHSFLTGYKKEVDLKTIFYVLPIIMYKDSRDRLNNARTDSTLYSLFSKEIIMKEYNTKLNSKFTLNHVAELFQDYIEPTKQSIIILANQKNIRFQSSIVLLEDFEYNKIAPSIREYFKSAYYLGQIFSKIEVSEFESFLEIRTKA